ncbi:MAG: relaxase [Pseudomonadota bacterium]
MILHGNQRGGGQKLAEHVLNDRDNDFVRVVEMRGFMSDDVAGAFHEVEVLARSSTRCKQPFFSLSISPPLDAVIKEDDFIKAIDDAEERLGLTGQSRVVIFHEKPGLDEKERHRHAHAIWSRIDAQTLKAVPLPYTKMKLRKLSRALFVRHDLECPRGLIDRSERDPLNYDLETYQKAKRAGRHPRQLKADIQNAWAQSDSRAAFDQALSQVGLRLSRGNRRGFVVSDSEGEVFSLPRMLDIRTKQVRQRLGTEDALPTLERTQSTFARDLAAKMSEHQDVLKLKRDQERALWRDQRQKILDSQREERAKLKAQIQARALDEAKVRQARFRSGLSYAWDWLRGENARIRKINEEDATRSAARDVAELEAKIRDQQQKRAFWADRHSQRLFKLRDQYLDVAEDRKLYNERSRCQNLTPKQISARSETDRPTSTRTRNWGRNQVPEP